MARGKYLSLEEARRSGKIEQFCKEHPSKGDWNQFDATMDSIAGPDAKSSSRAERTRSRAHVPKVRVNDENRSGVGRDAVSLQDSVAPSEIQEVRSVRISTEDVADGRGLRPEQLCTEPERRIASRAKSRSDTQRRD